MQLYLDYAEIVSRFPEALHRQDEREVADVTEFQSLNARIRKLISAMPDLVRRQQGGDRVREAAVSTMLSTLLDLLDSQGSIEPVRDVYVKLTPWSKPLTSFSGTN